MLKSKKKFRSQNIHVFFSKPDHQKPRKETKKRIDEKRNSQKNQQKLWKTENHSMRVTRKVTNRPTQT
jgi:hypothetical protein